MSRETLEGQTAENFAPHQEVFANYQCTIVPSTEEKGLPTLVVKAKKGKKQLNITPNSNVVTYGKKGENTVQLNSVVVYVDQNNTFYLPKKLVEYLQ
jgi:alkaline phosphatase